MQITQEICLDTSYENKYKVIHAKQNDLASRFLKILVTKCGEQIEIPSTATIYMSVEKPDGDTGMVDGCSVNEDGTLSIPLIGWMLQAAGMCTCCVNIYDDDKKLSSLNFHISIEPSIPEDTPVIVPGQEGVDYPISPAVKDAIDEAISEEWGEVIEDEVERQLPDAVEAEVNRQLPDAVEEQLPGVVEDQLPDVVDEQLQNFLKKTQQTLTEAEKKQVRENLSAFGIIKLTGDQTLLQAYNTIKSANLADAICVAEINNAEDVSINYCNIKCFGSSSANFNIWGAFGTRFYGNSVSQSLTLGEILGHAPSYSQYYVPYALENEVIKKESFNLENGSGVGDIQQKFRGIAKGYNSAAFNSGIARGGSAFAEGDGIAMEKNTHAEGEWSYADGWCAHAEGSTNAHTSYKHTEGVANSDKDQTIHETGYGDFVYTAVDSKPSYQQACIDTQVPASGQPYILYFIELENGGHSLIKSKGITEAEYDALNASDIYTRTVDGKNVFEVYKTGSLANGVHIDKLKQYIIAYLDQLYNGIAGGYETMNLILSKSYRQTLIDTASYLDGFTAKVAEIFELDEQQQAILSFVSSVDALASVVIILAFSLTDPTTLADAITSGNQQVALTNIIRDSGLLDDNAMLSPVSLASGTANEIFSMAAAAIGYKNRIGSAANIASGTGSEAIGVNNIVEGQNSIAVGDSNKIEKANSSGAFGNSNEVKPHDNSYEMMTAFALGRFLKNMYSRSLVIGSYNDTTWDASKPDKLFQVGNGTAENARSNAFEVLADGRAKVNKAPEENNDVVRKQELDTKVDSGTLSLSFFNNLY